MQYKLLLAGTDERTSYGKAATELTREVNDYLRQGWELWGSPVALPESSDKFGFVAQAVRKINA